jgi:hypothetical protein
LIDSRKRNHRLFKDIINGASFLIPFGIIIGILNYFRFNNVFEFGYGGHPGIGFSLGDFNNLWYSSIFSLDYGILIFNPILLVFPIWLISYQNNRLFSCLILSISGSWFIFMCSYNYGWGWGWGQRYLFIIIPLLALPIAYLPSVTLNKLGKTIFLTLILASSSIQLISVATKFHEPLTMKSEMKDKSENYNLEQLPSTLLLFEHKLLSGCSKYPLSIIGGNPNKTIDLSMYDSFKGFNFWPIHALKFFELENYIRPTELIFLFLIVFIQFALLLIYSPILLKTKQS